MGERVSWRVRGGGREDGRKDGRKDGRDGVVVVGGGDLGEGDVCVCDVERGRRGRDTGKRGNERRK